MRNVLAVIACLASAALAPAAYVESFGTFRGNPVLSWDPDGRTMVLVEPFSYTDPNLEEWIAPKNSRVDGASIPQVFWSLMGGPFEGKYRNASIVHDTECTEPYKHHWRAVHEMFYLASRAGGVDRLKAKVMFAAVYHFGPRWKWNDQLQEKKTLLSADDFFRMRSLIRRADDIGLGAIEGLTHEGLVAQVSDIQLAAERRCGAEMDQAFDRYLNEQLSRLEFVPGGGRERLGSWENYLGCIR